MTQDSAAKTLHLRVTSPNTGTQTVYTITVRIPIHVTNEASFLSALSSMDNAITLDNSIMVSYSSTTVSGSGTFTGVLDGNGNTIMITDATAATGNQGLFKNNSGTIENLHVYYQNGFKGANANSNGGIVGENWGTIKRCYVTGGDYGNDGLYGRYCGRKSRKNH